MTDRERKVLAGGGIVIAILALYLLFWRGEPAPSPPMAQPPTQAVTSAPPPVVPQAPQIAPPADASQLRLHGVMGGGAIIGLPDGTQRYVPIGREVLPGVILKRLEVHHAVLDSGGVEVRLGFDASAEPAPANAGTTIPAQ